MTKFVEIIIQKDSKIILQKLFTVEGLSPRELRINAKRKALLEIKAKGLSSFDTISSVILGKRRMNAI